MTILDAPSKPLGLNVKAFRERIKCQAKYGSQECDRPAKWRIVMACCGANDFMCNPCLEIATSADDPAGSPFFEKGHSEYFGCEACAKLHPTWKSAVKEIRKL